MSDIAWRDALTELSVLNTHVDRLAQELRRRHPIVGELLLDAGDGIYEAAKLIESFYVDGELNACSTCGCTVEDGECVCDS